MSTGLDYYYSKKNSIRVIAGATVDIAYPIPVPLEYFGVKDYFNSTYVAVTLNRYFKKFSLGYGLHYSSNAWYQRDYGEEFWKTLQYNSPPIYTANQSLGIATNCNYRFGKHFVLGVNYQPSLFNIKPNFEFRYEHLISLDFLWKWKLKK